MTVYLDVGAVRIQGYLSRTRHLWGRRGASDVLSSIGDPDGELSEMLVAARERSGLDVQLNDREAPRIDGVVSVILHAPEGDPSEPATLAAASALAGGMAARLPGLQLTARAGDGTSYIEAHARMQSRPALLEWLPVQYEYPPSLRCEECGQDAAVESVYFEKDRTTIKACSDCAARKRGPSRQPAVVTRRSSDVGTFTIEARLVEAVHGQASDDFNKLAALGKRHTNHVATIVADGNSLGALFEAARACLRQAPTDQDNLIALSKLVHDVTWEALVAATRTVQDAGGPDAGRRLPVVPHILGGDDLLVTVTAEHAWTFVRALLRGFATGTASQEKLAAQAKSLGVRAPTLSAGMVISNSHLPFGQQVSLAESLLKQAKTAVQGDGDGYSVAWLDTTCDGLNPVADRRPVRLGDLDARADALTRLAGLAPSARQGLSVEIDTDEARLAQQRLSSRIRRMDAADAARVRGFLDAHESGLDERPWKAPECVRVLRDGLSIARWWG
jgi:hypothetical protein